MLKRVIVYNALANLQELTPDKYYDYFTFIEPVFKKTFFTMFNNADVPVANDTIENRFKYLLGEAPKIFQALLEAGIHPELGVMPINEDDTSMPIVDFITQLMALYMAHYEKDGRFANQHFQDDYFGRIEQLYHNKHLMDLVPDEYKYIFIFLVRKLLWYHTTINPVRDNLYLNGTVDELLNFILEYGDWYNTYTDVATAVTVENETTEIQPEIYEVEKE